MKHRILTLLLLILTGFAFAQPQPDPAQPFIVKPYLQVGRIPSPTSLQLLWHTPDSDAIWVVEQRTGSKGPWKKSDAIRFTRVAVGANSPRRVYSAALTGLAPGSPFNYRIMKGGKEIFAAEAIAPKSADQPYRFIAFGDIGAGTPEQKPLALRAFEEKPDLVVVAGDIVYEHGLVSEYDVTFWPIYNQDKADEGGAPLMRRVPFAAAPGNHDTESRNLDQFPDALAYYMFWEQPLNGPLQQEGSAAVPALLGSEANKKAFRDGAGDAYPRMTNYSFDYGNAHWTVVDSNPYVDWTSKELLDWVAADLASAKNATWRFVLLHHPGFNSAREHYEQQHMRLLSPIFEAGKVDVVFSGHVHNYQRSFPLTFVPDRQGTVLVGGRDGKVVRGRVVNGRWTLDKAFDGKSNVSPKGTIYLITGAGGQKLYNPEQNNDPDSWQKFTDKFISNTHSLTVADVNGKTLTVRQVTADGKEIDGFKIVKP